MFTGIIEEMGHILTVETAEDGERQYTIYGPKVVSTTKLGDSIAVNGTCLTVTEFTEEWFRVGVAPESLRKTNLGDLEVGSPVNLERAMVANSRIDGHFIQGHVDNSGVIIDMKAEQESLWVTIEAGEELLQYIVPKGFIALDGTSLTVVDVTETTFNVMLIAYTQNHIIIPKKQIGDRINIEVDILGKYVAKFIAKQFNPTTLRAYADRLEQGLTENEQWSDAIEERMNRLQK